MPKKILLLQLYLLFMSSIRSQQKLTSQYIDPFSATSCYVLTSKGDSILKNASGFFIIVKSKIFFVTNNHVVGGEYYVEEYIRINKKQPPPNSFPDSLRIRTYGANVGEYIFMSIPINFKTGKYQIIKLWDDENRKLGLHDVVAIQIPENELSRFNLNASNTLDTANLRPDLNLFPSLELFVVGFPLEFGQASLYPLWKRATIASEPNLKTTFFIDATTRQGMSGSPVFFRGSSFSTQDAMNMGGMATFLIGIYRSQNKESEFGEVIKLEPLFRKLSQMVSKE